MKKLMFLMMMFSLMAVFSGSVLAQNCKPGANQIALFVDINYKGKCVVLDAGELYNVEDVSFPNDTLSSVLFGSNIASVELFEHINLEGKSQKFNASITTLERSSIGNDIVSSMRINLK